MYCIQYSEPLSYYNNSEFDQLFLMDILDSDTELEHDLDHVLYYILDIS